MFMINNTWFRPHYHWYGCLERIRLNAVIYVAAMTSIDPTPSTRQADIVARVAEKKIMHITLPGILPTIILIEL